MPRERANTKTGVQFTRQSAAEIADFIRAARGGDRSQTPPRLPRSVMRGDGWGRTWVWARNEVSSPLPAFSAVELFDADGVYANPSTANLAKIQAGAAFLVARYPSGCRTPWTLLNSSGMASAQQSGMFTNEGGSSGLKCLPPVPRWGITLDESPYVGQTRVAVAGVVPAYLTTGPGIAMQQNPAIFRWAGPDVLDGSPRTLLGNLRATVVSGSTTPVVDVAGEAEVLAWAGAYNGSTSGSAGGWGLIRFAAPSPPSMTLAAQYLGDWPNDTFKTVRTLTRGYYDPPYISAHNNLRDISTNGTEATVREVGVSFVNGQWELISVPPKYVASNT